MGSASFTKAGTKATTPAKLNPKLFGAKEINHQLLHQAYNAYLANGRDNLANSKTRGMVRGGGRKPWRQKGTGRARVGSRRTPIWRGGGVIFGPTGNENYSHKLNTKTKRLAIIQALSALNSENRLIVIEDIALKAAKTAELVKLLNKIGAKGYTLIAVDSISEELKRASGNVPSIKVVAARYLNVARLMDADCVVFTKAALSELDDWLAGENKAGKNL